MRRALQCGIVPEPAGRATILGARTSLPPICPNARLRLCTPLPCRRRPTEPGSCSGKLCDRSSGNRNKCLSCRSIATHLRNELQGLGRARSSVRIERWSPEPKVRGSNPLGRIEESIGYTHARRPESRLVPVLCRFYFLVLASCPTAFDDYRRSIG